MCIRDRKRRQFPVVSRPAFIARQQGVLSALAADEGTLPACLLYTSDAADDPLCVALGGSRIINKTTTNNHLF